jgi:hypothetical protein
MNVGFQPCLRLIPDEIPGERLQPLAGRNCKKWSWRGSDPLPCAPRRHPKSPDSAPQRFKKASVSIVSRLLRWPLVFIAIQIIRNFLLNVNQVLLD